MPTSVEQKLDLLLGEDLRLSLLRGNGNHARGLRFRFGDAMQEGLVVPSIRLGKLIQREIRNSFELDMIRVKSRDGPKCQINRCIRSSGRPGLNGDNGRIWPT